MTAWDIAPGAIARLAVLACVASALATPAFPQGRRLPFERLTIMAPGSTGGRWDQTARAMEQVLERTGLAREVEVTNSPGAGGAIGLAQFVGQRGDGDSLLVAGLVMVSAIRSSRATVSLSDTTPIARLTGEYEMIALPSTSDLRDLTDLMRAVRANPGSVSWGGGSIGGADPILVTELARAIGVEADRMSYVAFSGGSEVADALLRNEVTVGISGHRELAPFIAAGRLRPLAISSPKRLPGVSVPTFREQGVDVTLVNWRALFAPPGITEEQRDRLVALVTAMVRTEAWREVVARRGWTDLFLTGDDFTRFLAAEQQHAAQLPDLRMTRPADPKAGVSTRTRWPLTTGGVAFLFGSAALVCVGLIAWWWTVAGRRERKATRRLEELEAHYRARGIETQDLLHGMSGQIERQFDAWDLTGAERAVAWLILKGLRHKEIASIRGTSERTVRQQALTVYKKAGLDGRTDFAAFFLSDLLRSPAATTGPRTV